VAAYVLVHGAYQGGWIWKLLGERLRAAGHLVHAPTLDGCGERHEQVRPGITVGTHAREIAGLLFYEDLRDVVLVGTSSGGMVVCQAAEQAADRLLGPLDRRPAGARLLDPARGRHADPHHARHRIRADAPGARRPCLCDLAGRQ